MGPSGLRRDHLPRSQGAQEDEHLGQIQGAFLELGSVFCLKQSGTQESPARNDGPPGDLLDRPLTGPRNLLVVIGLSVLCQVEQEGDGKKRLPFVTMFNRPQP